jgi:hypothetical protein
MEGNDLEVREPHRDLIRNRKPWRVQPLTNRKHPRQLPAVLGQDVSGTVEVSRAQGFCRGR